MHIAIIPDGNRRWAKANGVPTVKGHYEGSVNFERIVELLPSKGVDALTIWALSTENMTKRAKDEVHALWTLLRTFAKDKKRQARMVKNGIKVKLIGDIENLPDGPKQDILTLVEVTKDCTEFVLQIGINYGGHDELLRAIKKMVKQGLEVTKENVESCLDSQLVPDLIIRTGGHQRLSGLLPWQSVYSELYFTDQYWPAFDEVELDKAISFFRKEDRNFGK